MAELIPMICPRISSSGPPELPGLTAASVWKNSTPLSRRARPLALTIPRVTRLLQAEGIADRDDRLPDFHLVGIAQRQRHEIGALMLSTAISTFGIAADERGGEGAAIGELHLDVFHPSDDVMIREDVAFLRNDHAGAERGLGALGLRPRQPKR